MTSSVPSPVRVRCVLFATTLFVSAGLVGAQSPRFARTDELVPTPLPRLLALGDFNGDGMDDFAGPLRCDSTGSGLYLPSISGPSLAVAFDSAAFSPKVAAADFNGDGIADIVQINAAGNLEYALFSGGVPPANALPATGYNLSVIAAGDADGDGDQDLYAYHFPVTPIITPPPPCLFINQGDGAFVFQNGWYGLALVEPVRIQTADFDGDGNDDVIVQTINGIFVQRSFGDGTFDVPDNPAPLSATLRGQAAVGDVDGDGRKDLLFAYRSGNASFVVLSRLLPGTTYFVFAQAIVLPVTESVPINTSGAMAPTSVALIDLDQDGATEILICGPNGIEIRKYVGGTIGAPVATLPVWPEAIVPLEADEDGRTDLAALWLRVETTPLTTRQQDVEILFNDGAGGLVPSRGSSDIRRTAVGAPHFADVDGDGDPDLISYAKVGTSGAPVFALNDGRGVFTWKAPEACTGCPYPTTTAPYRFPGAMVDGDGDGDLDLFLLADSPTGSYRFLRNDGPAGFTTTFSSGYNSTVTSFVTADFNNDGYGDIASATTSAISVHFGGPIGIGGPAVNYATPPFTLAVLALDADSDGDVDLVSTNFLSTTLKLLVNDGAGGFTLTTLATSGNFLAGGAQLLAGDLDGDGLSDIVSERTWLKRTGPATFLGQGSLGSGLSTGARLALGDIDADGDLDVISSFGEILVNDGVGVFTLASLGIPMQTTSATPAVADVDGDGDADVAEPYGPVHMNLTRQLATGRTLRPGRPFEFRISGAPNAQWLVAAAVDTLPAPINLPPFGRLDLDPASAVIFSYGVTDAAGDFILSEVMDASATPAFVGVPLMFQAVVDGPSGPRLTNARRVLLGVY